MKNFLTVIFSLLLLLAKAHSVYAVVDPTSVANNRFGIHIIDENDLELAVDLVNSSGGEWGYVTLVIREDDRKLQKWQTTFDRLRELKLIPLIRLATKMENSGWAKPRVESIDDWVNFLNQLNWVVKNRYVILFNEPNHAQEWGGKVKPHEYAQIVRLFQQKLKEKSQDFFILPAGFDAAAPNSLTSLNMYEFFRKMQIAEPEIFSLFDGWSSHAYPNPNFSALPSGIGRNSIRGFEWEVNFLRSMGLKPNIPIFITETGWKHQEGISQDTSTYKAERVAEFFKEAFETAWSNSQIIAVTPFVLRYLKEPFDHFSWIKHDSQETYPQYQTVKNLPKVKGEPIQEHNSKFSSDKLPEKLVINSDYKFLISFKNTGQSIWTEEDIKIKVTTSFPEGAIKVSDIPKTKPFENATIKIQIKTPENIEKHSLNFALEFRGEQFGELVDNSLQLIPPPSLIVRAKLWIKLNNSADDFSLTIYDQEDLIEKYEPFSLINGEGSIDELFNVIPQRHYNFVLTKPNYLPRQETIELHEDETQVTFEPLLPFDFNSDAIFTVDDLLIALRYPLNVIKRISPFSN